MIDVLVIRNRKMTYAVSQSLLAFDELQQSLSLAKFHQEVDVVLVFEGIVQINNMRMLEFHVNFDFTFEFGLVPGLLQGVLADNLRGDELRSLTTD
jgi:hypothetical protein